MLFLGLFGAFLFARELFYGVGVERLRQSSEADYYLTSYVQSEAKLTRLWTFLFFLFGLLFSSSFFGFLPASFQPGFIAFAAASLPSLAAKNVVKIKSRRHAPFLLRAYYAEGSWEYAYVRLLAVLSVLSLLGAIAQLAGVLNI